MTKGTSGDNLKAIRILLIELFDAKETIDGQQLTQCQQAFWVQQCQQAFWVQ